MFTGIPYGLIMLLFDLIDGGVFIFSRFLFYTVLFGVLMSLTLVGFYKNRLNKKGINEITEDTLKVKQQVKIQSDLTKNELVKHLKNDAYFSKMTLEESVNEINLCSKVTWWSWGEMITILISTGNNKLNKFDITSKPKVSTTLVDFGKNKENILLLINLINRHSSN